MAWLTDVAPFDTIQSLWGNNVRNRIVQTFADVGEANSHLSAVPDGACCYITATDTTYIKRAGAWATLLAPYATFNPTVFVGASDLTFATSVTRSRWRRAYGTHIDWHVRLDVANATHYTGNVSVRLPVWVPTGQGANQLLLGTGTITAVAYAFGPAVTIDDSAVAIVNAAGSGYVTVNDNFSVRLDLSYEGTAG